MEKTALSYPEQEAKVVTPEKDQVAKAPNKKKRVREEQVAEAPERVREIWVRNPERKDTKCPLEHLDARWARTVYWSEREKAYKPRYPDVPVLWVRTPDWKPETDEEIAERRKGWADGYRLSHKEALLGGI